MKSNTNLILTSLFVGFIFLLFKLWYKPDFKNYKNYNPTVIGQINTTFKKDLNIFTKSTTDFKNIVEEFVSLKTSRNRLTEEYRKLRDAFKKVEFIIEYLDKEAYDKSINGAPLPKLEQKVADISVLQPHGFQVIDEIIGGADLTNTQEKEAFLEEVKILEGNVKNLDTYLKLRKISDRQVFEASRQAIIRLATLGITGFDTPGTLQGIQDASIVLQTLQKYIELYKPELKNINRIDLLKQTTTLLEKGLSATENSNFDNFNRLTFIKEVINPTYKSIKDIHLALNYETIDEVSRYIQALNYNADNLFDNDFLNAFYFVSLNQDSTYKTKAELGKLLFYDPILSQNNTMACVTCHNPEKGFTDGLTTSLSNNATELKRNAMTLNYSVYATRFFHDLRAKRLEDQFEHVVLSKDEFNSSYKEILEKLKSSAEYTALFKKAFPNKKQINFNDIDYALAAYVMKLNTFDSPIDNYFQNRLETLPKEVERGFNLFTGKAACATCHFTPLFSGNLPPLFIDSESEILGVPETKEEPWTMDSDLGRFSNGVTKDIAPFYEGAFKTPTIRNIALTSPYMHNGVFESLEEVMDFYNKGGGVGGGLIIEYQTLASEPLDLTDREIADIIAFMEALNDTKVFKRPKDIPRDFADKRINKRAL
jgi:cytochrome c peroxidase